MDRHDLAGIEYDRRSLRPDWRRWLRPDWEGFVHPAGHAAMRKQFALLERAFETPLARRRREQNEAREREEQAALEAENQREIEHEALKLKAELASLRFELILAESRRKAGFNPQQPRVPAANPDGGQWTSGGSSQGERVQSDEISAARRRRGHHYVTRELFERLEKEGLPTEALNVFEDATTGRLTDPRSNKNDAEHRLYNKAVDEQWQRFKGRNNIKVDQMSVDQARTFVEEIKNSNDPRIRDFNRKIWLREILRGGRLGGRGNE